MFLHPDARQDTHTILLAPGCPPSLPQQPLGGGLGHHLVMIRAPVIGSISFKYAIRSAHSRISRNRLNLLDSYSAVRHYEAGYRIRAVEVEYGDIHFRDRFVTGDRNYMAILKRQQRLAGRTAEHFQLR